MPEITQLLYVFQVKDRKVENMAIILTNGNYYIAHSNTGALIKVTDIKQAQDFHSVERAIQQRNKHPGKCAGYYFIDTALVDIIEPKVVVNVMENKEKQSTKKKRKPRHKQFTRKMRRSIYEKTQGHCYLCGEAVRFKAFEVEHKKPISKGGTDNLDNPYPSCHRCNRIKGNIFYEDFMERISQIFMYQMQTQYGNSLRWKFVNRELSKMM